MPWVFEKRRQPYVTEILCSFPVVRMLENRIWNVFTHTCLLCWTLNESPKVYQNQQRDGPGWLLEIIGLHHRVTLSPSDYWPQQVYHHLLLTWWQDLVKVEWYTPLGMWPWHSEFTIGKKDEHFHGGGGRLKTWKNQLQHAQGEKTNFYVIEHPTRVDSHVILWDEEKKSVISLNLYGSFWPWISLEIRL